MPDIHTQPLRHPGAWTPADLEADPAWRLTLSDAQREELAGAAANARAAGLGFADITPQSFPLAHCELVTAAIRQQLRDGRGMALLGGFPVEGHRREDIELMYWGFSPTSEPVSLRIAMAR